MNINVNIQTFKSSGTDIFKKIVYNFTKKKFTLLRHPSNLFLVIQALGILLGMSFDSVFSCQNI